MYSPFAPLRFNHKMQNSGENENSTAKILNGGIGSIFEEDKEHDLKIKRDNDKILSHPYAAEELSLPPIKSIKIHHNL
jgi:hypothetical protein